MKATAIASEVNFTAGLDFTINSRRPLRMSYDSRCYDLAALFLSEEPAINNERCRDELAQHIQTELESWIGYENGTCKVCGEVRGKHAIPCKEPL